MEVWEIDFFFVCGGISQKFWVGLEDSEKKGKKAKEKYLHI